MLLPVQCPFARQNSVGQQIGRQSDYLGRWSSLWCAEQTQYQDAVTLGSVQRKS